jgi:beta-xylosidase
MQLSAAARSILRLAPLFAALGFAPLTSAAAAPASAGPFSDPVAPVSDPQLQIPAGVRPLLEVWMRDTYVTDGGDGFYYLTGTTAAPGRSHCWDWNDGLHLWRSQDLKAWEHLGLIWSLDRDATWQRVFGKVEPGRKAPSGEIMDEKRRAIWAPEIHYIRSQKTWLIAACTNDGSPQKGSFILRSTSGKPEGPYENIPGNATGPIFPNIDGGLFEDDDGSVYFVGHNHFIARMKDDLSGLAEPVRRFAETPYDPEPYAEGAYLVKHAGKYHLIQTYWSFKKPDGRFSYLGPQYNHPSRHSYDVVVASADHIYGPYGPRYTAVVEGGHNNFFKDRAGRWWSTMFGNPRGASAKTAPFLCRPAILPLTYENGRFRPDPAR